MNNGKIFSLIFEIRMLASDAFSKPEIVLKAIRDKADEALEQYPESWMPRAETPKS